MESMTKFDQLLADHEAKRADLQAVKRDMENELQEAREVLKQAMITSLDVDTKTARVAIAKAKKTVEDLETELEDMDERLELLTEVNNERLWELYPQLVEDFTKAHNEATAEILNKALELKKLRCEFILKARELGRIGGTAGEAYSRLERAKKMLDIKERHWFSLPTLNLTSSLEGIDKPLAPSETEVKRAYGSGAVEPFIEYYGKAGELVSNQEARKRLTEGAESNG